MSISTPVNKSFPAAKPARKPPGRGLSLSAAIIVLCVSLFVSHTGLVRLMPDAGNLVIALTALLGALAILQWTAMGRARACRAAGDRSRANMVVTQALLLGLLETTLNWNGIVQLAAEGKADWTTPAASLLVAAFAIGGAWLNVTVKFTSCELLDEIVTHAGDEPADTPPGARAPQGEWVTRDNVHALFAAPSRSLDAAEAGIRALVQETAAARRAHFEKIQSLRDPVTNQWKKKTAAAPAPARRRKTAAA